MAKLWLYSEDMNEMTWTIHAYKAQGRLRSRPCYLYRIVVTNKQNNLKISNATHNSVKLSMYSIWICGFINDDNDDDDEIYL